MRPYCLYAIVALIALSLFGSASFAQTPFSCSLPSLPVPPDPIPACQTPCNPSGSPACGSCTFGSNCTVTTMMELSTALNCLGTTGQCTHITIPAGTTIPFCNTIGIGNDHAGLELTINGTLLWVGPAGTQFSTPTLINISGVRSGPVTINGSGSILSIYEPCRDPEDGVCIEPDSSAKIHIANGIRVLDSEEVTIAGTSSGSPLRFQKLSNGILVESDTSNTLTFTNLKIEGMTQYGIFVGAAADSAKVSGVTISNCHVQGAYDQHGFRIYANNVTVTDCTACLERASGIWVVEGKNITVDGFETDEYVRIGPNHECEGGGGPEKGERLMNASISGINADHIEVQSGVIGCWLTDLTAHAPGGNGMSISRGFGGNAVARTTNRIHWDATTLDGNTQVGINGAEYPTGCNGSDISPCVGDVNDDEIVDIDDLVAVILAWGPCDTPVGACWFDDGICHPHWTQSACTAAGGTYQGNGTDCWTNPTSAPCCVLDEGDWTCTPDVPPSACWGSNKKYLGDLTSCAGVNCATAVSTMPACTAGCTFAQFPCPADIFPERFGNLTVDVDDLVAVILNWGCEFADPTKRTDAPESIEDCEDECAAYDPTYGEEYAGCMDRCIQSLEERGLLD